MMRRNGKPLAWARCGTRRRWGPEMVRKGRLKIEELRFARGHTIGPRLGLGLEGVGGLLFGLFGDGGGGGGGGSFSFGVWGLG